MDVRFDALRIKAMQCELLAVHGDGEERSPRGTTKFNKLCVTTAPSLKRSPT
jgi:hypothetical protein